MLNVDSTIHLLLILIPILLSIVLHEVAHGYVAYKLGDSTAKRAGRLSLNPLKHIDPFGTVILPLLLIWSGAGFVFGWAKPVPVNFYNLKKFRRDMVLVASAGIVVNAILAAIAFGVLEFVDHIPPAVLTVMQTLFMINLVLILFNILPFPPLDGSKIFFGWIKSRWAQGYISSERIGLVVLIVFLIVVPEVAAHFGVDFDPFRWYIRKAMSLIP